MFICSVDRQETERGGCANEQSGRRGRMAPAAGAQEQAVGPGETLQALEMETKEKVWQIRGGI